MAEGSYFCLHIFNLSLKIHITFKDQQTIFLYCSSTLVFFNAFSSKTKTQHFFFLYWTPAYLLYVLADVNRKCWCVTTKGMHAVGQVEVVVLLQCLPEEKSFPKDIFSHFVQLYRDTLTG